ncbi:uncharacterized protein LOC106468526 [Limulus polyphemus]|uniref:Uncharacterized protein LOC106468526 n=1 Tax=Limulus polyphemus TaxID=6850 RepID=A0ABM1BLI1_LIMPO|nr:uncharacterized protein LOC106468526 [Limulus polyphemus]
MVLFNNMTVIYIICCALLLSLKAVTCEQCDRSGYQRCVKLMPHFTNDPEMLLVVTEDKLKILCQNFKNSTICFRKYIERCFDLTQRNIYKNLTQGTEEMMYELCDEKSEIRQRYLELTSCYKNLPKERRQMCLDVYTKANKTIKNTDMDYETYYRWHCCIQAHYSSCLKSVMKEFCDDAAADFFVSFKKNATNFVYKNCLKYTSDSLNCMSSGNIQTSSALLLILHFVFLIW